MTRVIAMLLLSALVPISAIAQKSLVLIDQDGSGPADGNQMAMMVLLQSPQVEVLGISIVTGDAWRDEEVQHTLRMLELTGHTSVPVVPGAVFPLVRTQEDTRLAMQISGVAPWLGAWAPAGHGAWDIPQLPEGSPKTQPAAEDAAHFMVRPVRAHPGQITVFAAGPLTNIALAIAIDPKFAEQTCGIVIMGGSLSPLSDDLELVTNPRHEMLDALAHASSPSAQYISKYMKDPYFMYDELAACAWLGPGIITKTHDVYMDVDLSHDPSYGHTLTRTEKLKPTTGAQLVHAQVDVDVPRFARMFLNLMTAH